MPIRPFSRSKMLAKLFLETGPRLPPQSNASGVFRGIIKGFKEMNNSEAWESVIAHLEAIFYNFRFSDPSNNLANYQSPIELNSERGKGNLKAVLLMQNPDLEHEKKSWPNIKILGMLLVQLHMQKIKLLERKQKLEKLSERTAELQSGAESFAKMANGLLRPWKDGNGGTFNTSNTDN